MDSQQFDDLLRFMSHSRRSALTALLVAASGLGDGSVIAGRRKRKKRKKRKKRCTPACAGKTCGDDGCGGSCGACFQGVCAAGTCTWQQGYEGCQDACRVACPNPDMEQRNPDTCGCCIVNNGIVCATDSQCCSGHCANGLCLGRQGLEPCTFDGQCENGQCRGGVCLCEGEVCQGICKVPCFAPRSTRDPLTCACCVLNGIQNPCGSSGNCDCCCSGQCAGAPLACVGRAADASCEFDAQCASGDCRLVPAGPDFYVYQCA